MDQNIINFIIFLALCFVGYLIFRNIPFKEGMEGGANSLTSFKSGVAGDAASYASAIKSHSIKYQDELHINKYRPDYENSILNLDELVDHLMLKEALNVNHNDHMKSMDNLAKLNGAKSALNNVMKFIDSK